MVITFAELAEQLNDPKVDQSIKILMDVLSGENNKKEKEDGMNMDNILENVIDEIVANIDSLDSLAYTITADNKGNVSIKEGLSFPSKESVTEEFKETEESIENYAFLVQEYRNELTKVNNDIESLLEEYKKTSMQKIKLTEEINNAREDFEKLSLEATRAFYMCYNEPSNQSTLKEKLIEAEYKKNSIDDLELELRSENEILASIPEALEEKYCIKEEIEDFLESLNESLQKTASSFYI
jgi:chromosome segregation ATPase